MNFDFIFSPLWQSIGAFLFVSAVIACSYGLTRNLEDEVEGEEDSTYKANPWEFKAVKKFK